MPKLRQIALNGTGGAFVDVLATFPCIRMEAMEDEAGTTQGIQVKSILDSFATTNTFSFGSEPAVIGSIPENFKGRGAILGYPAQQPGGNLIAATKICSLRSAGAAGTTVRVTEYE